MGGLGTGIDGSLPPHPLSVSAVHPLLVHHMDTTGSSNLNINAPNVPGTALTSSNGNAFQISGMGINATAIGGGLSGLGSAISPILRTMRHHFQAQSQHQQPQVQVGINQMHSNRPLRVSRFILPGIQLQLPATTNATNNNNVQPTPQTSSGAMATSAPPQPNVSNASATAAVPAIRSANLPYNTLNEILQGFETSASAMQAPPAPAIITAPSATSFIDLLTGQALANATQHHHAATTHHHHTHHGHSINLGISGSNANNAAATAAALTGLNNQEFLVNLNSYNNDGFGENIGNGTTNLYIIRTPLARWNEECTVLDSHSMHHAILLNKPKIMDALENYRNDELNEKREKKLKEEKEKQKRATTAAAAAAATATTIASTATASTESTETNASTTTNTTLTSTGATTDLASNNTNTPSNILEQQLIVTAIDSTEPEAMIVSTNQSIEPQPLQPTTAAAQTSSTEASASLIVEPINIDTLSSIGTTEQSTPIVSSPTIMEAEENTTATQSASEITSSVVASTEETSGTTAAASASIPDSATATPSTGPTFTTQAEREAATSFLINFVGATCSIFTIATLDERRIAIEALRMAEHQRASLELQAATADETNTVYPQNYVFLDGHVVEIPPGIDPSFLSALPDSLRREVIMEQLRILGIDIRNRPIPASATSMF